MPVSIHTPFRVYPLCSPAGLEFGIIHIRPAYLLRSKLHYLLKVRAGLIDPLASSVRPLTERCTSDLWEPLLWL